MAAAANRSRQASIIGATAKNADAKSPPEYLPNLSAATTASLGNLLDAYRCSGYSDLASELDLG